MRENNNTDDEDRKLQTIIMTIIIDDSSVRFGRTTVVVLDSIERINADAAAIILCRYIKYLYKLPDTKYLPTSTHFITASKFELKYQC